MIDDLVDLHHRFFRRLESVLDGWFLGLVARFAFAGVLLVYFLNAAMTKLGDGPLGFLNLSAGAYVQIVPPIMEAAGYDHTAVAFLPWGLIVHLGTYAEIVLPILVFIGLFTRLAALGMIGFVAVQSYVDIAFHGADGTTVGALFDRFADSVIIDQRTLWLVPLVYLVAKGAGAVSLDHLLARRFIDPLDEPLPAWR
jgi:putative oxidoreductase